MIHAALPRPTRTTCPYCGVGCGVVVDPDGTMRGDAAHPANEGRLCSKGSALGETLGPRGRLTHPEIKGRRASWDEALDLAAAKFAEAIRVHGPDSVAFYGSGQFLTEDYYVANKLMKGFFGSANIDTNSRLCMASSVAGHVRAFGEDVVPGCYEDIDEADLVVLVGSNAAWCHPILFRRLEAARKKRGTRIVVLDPRRTASCDGADLHLPLRAGSDVALFNGLLARVADSDALDRAYIGAHTANFDEALAAARAEFPTVAAVAAETDVPAADIEAFYRMFVSTERVVTLYSQGVNQSSAGTDKVNAIVNCHLAAGRVGKPGMGPFSLTGQPNAMGGREVGGLANQLAAHMSFASPDDIDRVRRFWNAPNMATKPGLKAVELFDAMLAGKIKAVWIAGTNPAVSLPRADRVRDALRKCPFVVVADCHANDTLGFAHVTLPARGWAEKDGAVTNSERRISRQRAFTPPTGEAMPDWWMFAELGKRMGWGDAFGYSKPADVFREHAALSAFENDGARRFDIGALADLADAEYEAMEPTQWPARKGAPAGGRLYGDGLFSHPDGRARFVATPFRAPVEKLDAARNLTLNTGRVRDQWHTMTRTGGVPRLSTHTPEPYLDIHPADAARAGLADGEFARVESRHGATIMRARVAGDQRPGEVHAAMHWSDANASTGPVDRLVGAATDPVSGQPELKATAVMVMRQPMGWHGLLLRREPLAELKSDYWCRVAIDGGFAYPLAGIEPLAAPGETPDDAWVLNKLSPLATPDLAVYADPARGVFRFASFVDGALDACLFVAREAASVPDRDMMAAMFAREPPKEHRARLLAGVPLDGVASAGPTICACFAVGRVTIEEAIASHGLTTAAQIGEALKAGTNCGSCLPELEKILRETAPAEHRAAA